MPTERLSMRRRRDLLRLQYAQGCSERAIARWLSPGKGTVGDYLARARQAGLSWPLGSEMDDDSLESLLFPSPTMASRLDATVPDWAVMDVELRRPGVTRAVFVAGLSGRITGRVWPCVVLRAFRRLERPGATDVAPVVHFQRNASGGPQDQRRSAAVLTIGSLDYRRRGPRRERDGRSGRCGCGACGP